MLSERQHLHSLSIVSHQLYQETASLIFRLNNFEVLNNLLPYFIEDLGTTRLYMIKGLNLDCQKSDEVVPFILRFQRKGSLERIDFSDPHRVHKYEAEAEQDCRWIRTVRETLETSWGRHVLIQVVTGKSDQRCGTDCLSRLLSSLSRVTEKFGQNYRFFRG